MRTSIERGSFQSFQSFQMFQASRQFKVQGFNVHDHTPSPIFASRRAASASMTALLSR